MQNVRDKEKFIRGMGVIGIIAIIITMISDVILLGKPTHALSFIIKGTETMSGIAPWRVMIGSILGVLFLPFQIFGLVPVYYGIKISGKRKPFAKIIPAAHALIMGVAFHISYVYIGRGWRLHHRDDVGNSGTLALMNSFDSYWRILIVVMFVDILCFSIIFAVTIWKGNTLYPKWMVFLNPLCVVMYLFPFVFIIPAPIGGYIAPTYLNLSTLVFMVLSTNVISNKIKNSIC